MASLSPNFACRHRWHPIAIISGLTFVTALWLSWAFSFPVNFWNQLDVAVFKTVNPTLAEPGTWQALWAITNWRGFDMVGALLSGLLLLGWIRANDGHFTRVRLAKILAFACLMLAVKELQDQVMDHLHYYRFSPTRLDENSVRVSQLVSWIKTKDGSGRSFPGDHAFILFSTIGFLWICGGARRGRRALLTLLPLTVPRVMIGAHWLTDVVVGGFGMALFTIILGYATPLTACVGYQIIRRGRRLLDMMTRVGRSMRIFRRIS